MTPAASDTNGRAHRRYGFGSELPLAPIRAGTNVLVEGSGIEGTGRLVDRLLTAGRQPGEATVLVSTDGSVEAAGRRFEDVTNVGLVCCAPGAEDGLTDDISLSSVASPGDLTGIGIRFSKVADAVTAGDGAVRVGVDSVSTLLMYVDDPRSVFRFVHAFTGRIAAMDGLGAFVVDPEAHDDRTLAMVRGSFDGRIRVRAGDGGPELRTTGLAGQPEGWQSFRLGD